MQTTLLIDTHPLPSFNPQHFSNLLYYQKQQNYLLHNLYEKYKTNLSNLNIPEEKHLLTQFDSINILVSFNPFLRQKLLLSWIEEILPFVSSSQSLHFLLTTNCFDKTIASIALQKNKNIVWKKIGGTGLEPVTFCV